MATKYQVILTDGGTAELELKDREAVRRVFQNHGFWYDDTFYAAGVIHSIKPIPKEEEDSVGE